MKRNLAIFLFLFLTFSIVIILFLGYWLMIRPSIIRRDCYWVTEAKTNEPGNQDSSYLNNVYRACLASNGLKPEDLMN